MLYMVHLDLHLYRSNAVSLSKEEKKNISQKLFVQDFNKFYCFSQSFLILKFSKGNL